MSSGDTILNSWGLMPGIAYGVPGTPAVSLQSIAAGHDRRVELLHPCVPGRLQSLHFLWRWTGAALRGFTIDEQKLRHDGTPDGFACVGGGLSPAFV